MKQQGGQGKHGEPSHLSALLKSSPEEASGNRDILTDGKLRKLNADKNNHVLDLQWRGYHF